MTDLCQRLDWDSDFFGYRIGRVEVTRLTPDALAQIDVWSAAEHIDCLYFLADPVDYETAWLAQRAGFVYVDTRVTLTIRLTQPPEVPIFVRASRPTDLPALIEIARSAHRDSRFYFDPVFPVERCDALFAAWIARSVEGHIADVVLVAAEEDVPLGYSALKLAGDTGKLSLIGVGEAARGRGLGSMLVRATLRWFWDQGVRTVEVVTQGRNIGAQRLYGKGGFLPTATANWYHRWSPDILAARHK